MLSAKITNEQMVSYYMMGVPRNGGIIYVHRGEYFLLAVKGRPLVTLSNQTTLLHGRVGEHSQKPEEFYRLIEALLGANVSYLPGVGETVGRVLGLRLAYYMAKALCAIDQLGSDSFEYTMLVFASYNGQPFTCFVERRLHRDRCISTPRDDCNQIHNS
jgi:hypothetical protein